MEKPLHSPTIPPLTVGEMGPMGLNVEGDPTQQGGTGDDAMWCSDLSIILPFIIDDGYCNRVKDKCCLSEYWNGLQGQPSIPEECMMCGQGFMVFEEKELPNSVGTMNDLNFVFLIAIFLTGF
jgi:hypothetical protein